MWSLKASYADRKKFQGSYFKENKKTVNLLIKLHYTIYMSSSNLTFPNQTKLKDDMQIVEGSLPLKLFLFSYIFLHYL